MGKGLRHCLAVLACGAAIGFVASAYAADDDKKPAETKTAMFKVTGMT
ncbi:MAG: hypothetical protein NTW87_22335 [Planctomycetota bacterium]|nr:hypothetical protein [Planctomycetota bacterium]